MIALEDAIALAARLHKDQVDLQGEPYILHPLRVMGAVPDYLRVVAVLHDVLEDCDITKSQLGKIVQDEWTMVRLDLLTEQSTESRPEYIERVCFSPESVVVKCADLNDNLGRSADLDAETVLRLRTKHVRDFEQITDWYMSTFSQERDRTVPVMDAVFNAIAKTSRLVRELAPV